MGDKTYAKVMIEMRAQLEDEMDLHKDEVLIITEIVDKMYFRGQSADGTRVGIIPKRFVHVLDHIPPNDPLLDMTSTATTPANGAHNHHIYTNDSSLYENTGDINDCPMDSPPSYDHVISSMMYSEAPVAQPSSLGYSNAYVGDVQSYGRALFSFHAVFPNELSLRENEIVHLIRHIDGDWIEGECDGRVGIFPKSFVEIIVDCDRNNSVTAADESHLSGGAVGDYELFPTDTFGRVLYDFDGEIETDLRIRAGDTITLIRKADTNWWEAMDDLGNVGLIPGNYCELIDADISAIHSANSSTLTTSFDETPITQDYGTHVVPNSDHNTYSSDLYANDSHTTTPVITTTLADIIPVIIPEVDEQEVQDFPITQNYTNDVDHHIVSDHNGSALEPKLSPLVPRRAAPSVPNATAAPKTPDMSAAANRHTPKVSPHRPPPPVPKHKGRHRSNDSIDSVHMTRLESVRSSITSNSSSSSGKSDTASGGVATPTATTSAGQADSGGGQQQVDSRRKKVREQRGCVIMELLQTERDYRMNLEVCADIFLKNPEEAKNNGVDLKRLFGNLEDIIDVSALLIRKLEESTQMKKYEHQMVGKCFLDVLDQMKDAYSLYCKNHDQLQPLWNRYDAQPDAKQYLARGLDVMRERTNCFDIPSVLIKPVQRILKYPLLLNELHKCTEDGHEDKPDLILAIDRITGMATRINEFKRRQDLVEKYRSESSQKLTSRLSKLNLHTVMKKGSRLGHRISSTLGLSPATKDDEFNRVVQKFRTVEKTIKIFAKDKQAFVKSVEDFSTQGLAVVEAVAEYYDKRNRQQEVEQLRTTHRVIVTQYWREFDTAVDRDVTPVLDKLLAKFAGPNKLIAKRFDKMADFDSMSKKVECNKDCTRQRQLQDQQQLAKHVYEALNTQLLEELPRLCDLSLQILQDCIQAFLLARKQLIGRIARHHLSLLELPLVASFANGSAEDITETFQIKYNLITEQLLDDISILPAHVFPNACPSGSGSHHSSQTDLRRQSTRNSRRSLQLNHINLSVAKTVGVNTNMNRNVQQSGSQRQYLQSRYQSHQLFTATERYEACDLLDIYLNAGDLVGVLKRQDPMGSPHRWYVDTGSAQGFVLANALRPYHDDSWVTAPPDTTTAVTNSRPQTIYEKPEKRPLTYCENQAPVAYPYPTPTVNPTNPSSLVQHQYKVHPTPEPPVQYRHDPIEHHRYEEVPEDSPPRYSRLDVSGDTTTGAANSSLLSFDESIDEKQGLKSGGQPLYGNVDEFDPYAPVAHVEKSQTPTVETTTYHRYEEVPEAPAIRAPVAPQITDENLYFAAYPFRANDTNQLTLEFGQPVALIKDRDLNGNSQWWFVADKAGRTGYVPANYLQKYHKK